MGGWRLRKSQATGRSPENSGTGLQLPGWKVLQWGEGGHRAGWLLGRAEENGGYSRIGTGLIRASIPSSKIVPDIYLNE